MLALADPRARDAFAALAAHHDSAEIWAGLSAAALQAADADLAARACARLFSQFAFQPAWTSLGQSVGRLIGGPGWCGLTGGGGPDRWRLRHAGDPATLDVRLDGVQLRATARGFAVAKPQDATRMSVTRQGQHLLGSPLRIDRINRLDGFVERTAGGIRGWAWHPHDAQRDPLIAIVAGTAPPRHVALRRLLATGLPGMPLARPRVIDLPPPPGAGLARLSIRDPQGHDLPGSPLVAARARRPSPPPAQVPRRAALLVLQVGGHPDQPPAVGRAKSISIAPGAPALADAIAAAPGRDVLLLTAGVRLSRDAVRRLRSAVYGAADIGSAAPLPVALPLFEALEPLASASGSWSIPSPPRPAAALYLRHDCVAATTLRAGLFGHAPAAACDLLQRVASTGWRHAVGAAISAAEPERFASEGHRALAAHDRARLGAPSPEPDRAVAWRRDLLAGLFQQAGTAPGAVLLITHARGGGVEQAIRQRITAAREEGLRPIILRPAATGSQSCVVSDDGPATGRELRYRLPAEWPALVDLLASQQPRRIELHHRLGHHPDMLSLAGRLGVPVDIWVHDYAGFCPRIDLVGVIGRYCGEPSDPAVCMSCVAALGSELGESIGVPALRARTAGEFAAARRIIVPTEDVARRLRRQFPGVKRLQQQPLDSVRPAANRPPAAPLRVCVIGAVGVEKGRDILLACARDAAARSLRLSFTLVGYSTDDAALLASGVWVTGEFREAERAALIEAQAAHIAFLPSVWPETWSFALSHAWAAGLPAAVFDLGGPAERIRAAGERSGIILPPNLSAAAINDRLLLWSSRLR